MLAVKVFVFDDADQGQKLVDLPQIQVQAVVEFDQAAALRVEPLLLFSQPVDATHVDHNIDHVAAQLIGDEVDRSGICCDVQFADYIEDIEFVDPRVGK